MRSLPKDLRQRGRSRPKEVDGVLRALGFDVNQKFTDEKVACMVISDEASLMLLSEPFFKRFTTRELCDTTKHTEALFALSCGSREEVDTYGRESDRRCRKAGPGFAGPRVHVRLELL